MEAWRNGTGEFAETQAESRNVQRSLVEFPRTSLTGPGPVHATQKSAEMPRPRYQQYRDSFDRQPEVWQG